MPENPPPLNLQRFATIQAVLTAGLGFGGDKLQSVLDRSDEFAEIANKSGIISAVKDDLDAFSVAVGLSVALKEFATFETGDMAGHLERIQKAEDN